VVLVDGRPVIYLERGGATIQTLAPADDEELALAAFRALRGLLERPDPAYRELVVSRIDGVPVNDSPARSRLVEAGFLAGYRGLVLRPDPAAPRSTTWAAAAGRSVAAGRPVGAGRRSP